MKNHASHLTLTCLISLMMALVLPGCSLYKKAPKAQATATGKQISPVATAAQGTDNAIGAVGKTDAAKDGKQAQIDGANLADASAIISDNDGNPDGPAKTEVDGEATNIVNRLSNATADPVEIAAAAQRKALVESGKTAEARQAYTTAQGTATGLATQLGQAKQDAKSANDALVLAHDAEKKAQSDLEKQLAANKIANQAAISAAVAEAEKAAQSKQVLYLNIFGGICLLGFAGIACFTGIAGAKAGIPLAGIGVLAFGLAQLVAMLWFKYACGASLLLAIAAALWWIWSQHKTTQVLAATKVQAATVTSALNSVLPVLDKAYETATPEQKTVLDATVFQPLSDDMSDLDKSVIHTVRAAIASPSGTPPSLPSISAVAHAAA